MFIYVSSHNIKAFSPLAVCLSVSLRIPMVYCETQHLSDLPFRKKGQLYSPALQPFLTFNRATIPQWGSCSSLHRAQQPIFDILDVPQH